MSIDTSKFNSLQQWLDWQQQLHPDEIELGLERVNRIWQALGAPALAETVITVAGTNGKGSSIAYLEAIYTAAGYRVGSYTSPHLYSYTERIRIDCEAVSEQKICEAFQKIENTRQDTRLTYFEYGTLAAFDIFSNADIDIALLEVGLGGRLDAVNIVDADAVLLTSIGIDHVDWLGDTREKIGEEKAGVLRSGQVVVCSDKLPPESVLKIAHQLELTICLAERDYQIKKVEGAWHWLPIVLPNSPLLSSKNNRPLQSLPFPTMRGETQLINAAGALAIIMNLYQQHPVAIDAVRTGLQSARVAGRFEVIPGDISWILDVAHNIDSAQVLAENLKSLPCAGRSFALFSVLQDKDLASIAQLIHDQIDEWVICPLNTSRGRSFKELTDDIEALKLHSKQDLFRNISIVRNTNAAMQLLLSKALPGDRIVVFGSFFLVAEVMSLMPK